MVPAGDALVLLLLLLAPLLPPPPLTLLLPLPAAPPLPPAGCCLLLRPAGGFWRTWRDEEKESVSEAQSVNVQPATRGVIVRTLVSVMPRRAMLPELFGLALTVLSSCSMEQRSAMRASRSTFSL